jgi:phage repressor protein C with HTH and peptisase S24 domain
MNSKTDDEKEPRKEIVIRRENLKRLIEKHFKGRAAYLADELERPRPHIYGWLTGSGGRSFGPKIARDIEKQLKIEPFWLDIEHKYEGIDTPTIIFEDEPKSEDEVKYSVTNLATESPSDTVRIPQFDAGGKMGNGLILQDQPGVIASWQVSQEWIQMNTKRITSAKNLVIVTGFCDSMKPLYNPGDPLLVDAGVKELDHDGTYFFRVGADGFIKKLQRIPGKGVQAISINTEYDKWTITKDMDFEIFGRVVKAWSGEDL